MASPLDNAPAFAVNAHCTGLVGTVEDSKFYNRYLSNADYIGYEYVDPGFEISSFATALKGTSKEGPCDGMYRCRRSDLALVRATVPSFDIQFGYIARTDDDGVRGLNGVGSLRLSTIKGPMKITGEDETPETDYILEKVGAASGWLRVRQRDVPGYAGQLRRP